MSEKLLSDDDLVAITMLSGTIGDKIKVAFEPVIDAVVDSARIALSAEERCDPNRVGYMIARQLVVAKAITEIAVYMLGRTFASSVTPNITMLTADTMIETFGKGLVDALKGRMILDLEVTTKSTSSEDADINRLTQHFAAIAGLEIMAHAMRERTPSDNTNRPRPSFKIV